MSVWTIHWRRERKRQKTRWEVLAVIPDLRILTLPVVGLLFIAGFGGKITSQCPSTQPCELLSVQCHSL